MDIQELNAVISDFVQVGYMEAVKAYEPEQDLIKKTDVEEWLKKMRMDVKKFHKLIKIEIIKPFKKGNSINSPLFYSKKEIKQAFSMVNVSRLITNKT